MGWLLFLQFVLGSSLIIDFKMQGAIKTFRNLHVDYPKFNFSEGFLGYCNGFMAYVRGKRQNWYCPAIHYVVHAPWKDIRKFCTHTESFCENYNKYCTITSESYPVTVCFIDHKQPAVSCRHVEVITHRRLYLLCSHKKKGYPVDIIGLGSLPSRSSLTTRTVKPTQEAACVQLAVQIHPLGQILPAGGF
ncbi:putative inactive ribonuclease-like protein 13 [Ctenodactylus gundi]